mmetsp:Transcript_21957/g.47932  ORF Transcript_21957/g.47932 Transcript_21957/m.47932 type:complete len:334 (+) Transcript_21957:22-1023(+)
MNPMQGAARPSSQDATSGCLGAGDFQRASEIFSFPLMRRTRCVRGFPHIHNHRCRLVIEFEEAGSRTTSRSCGRWQRHGSSSSSSIIVRRGRRRGSFGRCGSNGRTLGPAGPRRSWPRLLGQSVNRRGQKRSCRVFCHILDDSPNGMREVVAPYPTPSRVPMENSEVPFLFRLLVQPEVDVTVGGGEPQARWGSTLHHMAAAQREPVQHRTDDVDVDAQTSLVRPWSPPATTAASSINFGCNVKQSGASRVHDIHCEGPLLTEEGHHLGFSRPISAGALKHEVDGALLWEEPEEGSQNRRQPAHVVAASEHVLRRDAKCRECPGHELDVQLVT